MQEGHGEECSGVVAGDERVRVGSTPLLSDARPHPPILDPTSAVAGDERGGVVAGSDVMARQARHPDPTTSQVRHLPLCVCVCDDGAMVAVGARSGARLSSAWPGLFFCFF